MKHLRELPNTRTAYHSTHQRTEQLGEQLAAMWIANDIDDLQQNLWLASVYAIEAGGNEQGTIAMLEGSLMAMADHDDVQRSWLYQNRLNWHRRAKWRMVKIAYDKYLEWFTSGVEDEFDVIEL
ncbi:MAG: hypothetical protein ABJI96_08025 [Paracoccaceae bacterium]